jgi:hypothetical protein
MSDGDSIKAGQVTLSESTTDLVGARTGEDFPNRVIFRVGPFYDTYFNCNGIMGLGNDANDHQNFGTGVIGLGSPLGGIGVQGRGGGFKPEGRPDANGGIGVQGIGGDINALNLEFVQPATGVLGIGGNASDDFNPPGTGVEGIGGASRINGGGVGVKGTGKLDAAGVFGIGDSGNGVRGDSANNDGVFGFSSTNNRSGVYGFNSTANDRAWGVTGRCNAPEGGGVFGVNGAPNGMGVYGRGFFGVKGEASPGDGDSFHCVGVFGLVQSDYGAAIHGEAKTGHGTAVSGEGYIALAASAWPRRDASGYNAYSGIFDGGPLLLYDDLMVTGAKSAVVPHEDGSHRRFFCMEAPESWFEDFGEAELVHGKAAVRLDPDFAHSVDTSRYHVFVSSYGEAEGLHVARRHSAGFEVSGKSAAPRTPFSYRVVARRKDVAQERMPKVKLPKPPAVDQAAPQAAAYARAGGPRLTQFLDGLPVPTRWIHRHRVVWQTGQQDAPQGQGPEAETHCSAFVAAVALMLDIYLLRPPHHSQELLANAQADWLAGDGSFPGPTAATSGWAALGSSAERKNLVAAAEAANAGRLVVGVYKAPPVRKSDGKLHQVSGHICIVRPQDAAPIGDDGPRVVSVADVNRRDTSMRMAFHAHPEAWPNGVRLYAHDTDLQKDPT